MKKLVLLLLLSACSFRPVFTGHDTDVYVAPISGINGIELRNSLNDGFGGVHDMGAKYNLTVKLSDPITKYKALERTGDATWQEVTLNASYELKDGETLIAKGSETASESYMFVQNLVASNASYNNAVRNIIHVLGEKISMRVNTETQKYQTGIAK